PPDRHWVATAEHSLPFQINPRIIFGAVQLHVVDDVRIMLLPPHFERHCALAQYATKTRAPRLETMLDAHSRLVLDALGGETEVVHQVFDDRPGCPLHPRQISKQMGLLFLQLSFCLEPLCASERRRL